MSQVAALSLPIPCPVLVTDAHGRMCAFNDAMAALHGDGGGESMAIGAPLEALFTPASRIFLQTHVWPLLWREGRVSEIHLQALTGQGQAVPVMVNAQVEGDGDNRRCVWVCFEARDRSRFEAELLKARQEAQRMAADLRAAHAELSRLNDELSRRAQSVEAQNRELAELSQSDPLTGLGNRRALNHAMAIWREVAEPDSQTAMLLVDVDHFKAVNDRFGHDEGDRVLVAVARALEASVRARDLVARYGGEEFAIWLPFSDVSAACAAAQRVHEQIRSVQVGGEALTVSIGVASLKAPAAEADLQALLNRADQAVYAAKHAGRNRTQVAL